MPKKSKWNAGNGARPQRGVKAQAIRDTYKLLGGSARPVEVIKHLAGQGITVSYSQVISVREALKRQRRHAFEVVDTVKSRRKPGKKARRKAVASGGRTTDGARDVTFEMLVEAKQLAERLGGIEKAKAALDGLAELR